jgi:rod shape-determining protein MreC
MLFLNKNSKQIVLSVVIIFLLFFLHYLGVLRPIENSVIYLTKPFLRVFYGASNWVGTNYLDYRSKQSLIEENNELKNQLLTLIKEKSVYQVEAEENEFLKSQINFSKNLKNEFEVARVIGQNTELTQNSLIIDKGESSGLIVGLPVLGDNGVLIGKVYKVNKTSAMVLLINDDLSKVSVKVLNGAKTIGLVEGEYGIGIKMRFIPQSETVKVDDIVVTSGLEQAIPKGLVVGQIKKVKQEPEQLFQEASIESLIDFNKVTLVNIIKRANRND